MSSSFNWKKSSFFNVMKNEQIGSGSEIISACLKFIQWFEINKNTAKLHTNTKLFGL